MSLLEMALLAALLGDAPVEPAAQSVDAKQVRPAVERSLPYLEKEGLEWLDKRKCVSCHHGPFMKWSLREAKRRGFSMEPQKVEEHTQRILTMFLADRKKYETEKKGYVESMNLLLGFGHPAAANEQTGPALDVLSAIVLNGQQAEGHWKYAGQGQNRPAPEADQTTTGWAILAVSGLGKTEDAMLKNRERALAWLKTQPTGEGNEARVLRLLIEIQFGDPSQLQSFPEGNADRKSLIGEIVKTQNADGGWSWAKGQSSDSFATGQSLYALAKAGVSTDDAAIKRGWQFLVGSQRPNGSWYAASKKPGGNNHVISSYWGSTWAMIGLLATLPENPEPSK